MCNIVTSIACRFQLEASIKNGDLQGFQIFSEAAKHLSSRSREDDTHFKGHKKPEVSGT